MIVGKQIKYYRKVQQLTSTELANQTGIAKSYLSALENEKKINPTIEILESIAAALKVDVTVLLEKNIEEVKEASLTKEEREKLIINMRKAGIDSQDIQEFLAYQEWKRRNGLRK